MNGELILNPTSSQLVDSDFNLIVAGSREAVVMVEGGAKEVSEEDLVQAVFYGHRGIQDLLDLQKKLGQAVGNTKKTFPVPVEDEALKARVFDLARTPLLEALALNAKIERQESDPCHPGRSGSKVDCGQPGPEKRNPKVFRRTGTATDPGHDRQRKDQDRRKGL